MKEFDTESLASFNGKDGKPAYVAHKGKVIDVTTSKLWKSGQHMKRHQAGSDLTMDIPAAPHGPEVLGKYPQVGTLKKEITDAESLPNPLETLLNRYPVLRRHPHPILVHFPIVFMISPALFCLLYLITDVKSFETTAFHCLGAGILFSVPAILTGFLTWWINYQARPMRPVRIKIIFTIMLMAVSLVVFLWRIMFPDDFLSFNKEGILYFLLVLSLVPIVSVIGWYGATLTFPRET
ncbi:MAG TPA: DUF2231 domain-containing protein [Desulfomonilia bacterium]|nr:DUF2231 domain-containing protein [Desulfomonilia bacterium]